MLSKYIYKYKLQCRNHDFYLGGGLIIMFFGVAYTIFVILFLLKSLRLQKMIIITRISGLFKQ